jgi:hypothetical protein
MTEARADELCESLHKLKLPQGICLTCVLLVSIGYRPCLCSVHAHHARAVSCVTASGSHDRSFRM